MSDFDKYYNNLATTESSFDDYYNSLGAAATAPTKANTNQFSIGGAIRQFDTNLGGIIDDKARKASRQKQQLESIGPLTPTQPNPRYNRNLARKVAAAGAGIASLADTAMNVPRYGINKANEALGTGVKLDYSHLTDDYNNLPGIKDLRAEAPEYFDQYADAAGAVLPLPGRAGEIAGGALGKFLEKSAARRIGDAALTQGALGSATAINSKLHEGQDPSLLDIGLGFGGGALMGGAAHGLAEGAGAVLSRLTRKPAVMPVNDNGFGGPQLNDQDIAGNLEGEDAAIFAQMRRPQSPQGTQENPLQGGVSQNYMPPDPIEEALGDVETAGPLALKDAIDNAKRAITSNLDKEDHPEALSRLQQAIKTNEDWQFTQANQPDRENRRYLNYGKARGMEEFIHKYGTPSESEYGPFPMQGPRQPEPQSLGYPNYLDFDQRPKPQFTRVDRGGGPQPVGYPDYVDFSRQGPTWNMRDYLDVNQHPDGLQYPNYLDFGGEKPPRNDDGPLLPPPQDPPLQGEVRGYLPRSQYGHNEAFPGAGNTPLDPEAQMIMQDLAETKARLTQREAQISELATEFYKRAEQRDEIAHSRVTARIQELELKPVKQRSTEEKRQIRVLKKELETIENRQLKYHEGGALYVKDFVASLGSERLELNSKGRGLLDQFKSRIQKPEDKLKTISKERMQVVGSPLEKPPADFSLLDDEPALAAFVHQQAQDEERLNSLKKLMEHKYEFGNNPLNWPSFDHTIDVNDTKYTVLLRRHQESKTIEFADERASLVAAEIERLKADPTLTRLDKSPAKLTVRKNSKLLEGFGNKALVLGGLATVASDQGAQAADGSDEPRATPGTATAIGGLLIGAGFIKHPKAFMQLIESTAGKAASRAAFIYADMLDNARALDKILGATAEKSLENQMMKHQALVLQSQFGVKFASQEQKAALYQMVREGKVTPRNALAGQGPFANLNQKQREAIVNYYLYTKSLAKIVTKYREQVEKAIKGGTNIGAWEHEAIVMLDEALNPSNTQTKGAANLVAAATGHVMDGLFTLNPEHHLLNLTDSILSGASRTGPINMLKAWVDLSKDRELSNLFKDSGLFGSFRADRNEIAKKQVAGTLDVPQKEMDFGSDKFNADRVFLAALYQRFQEKAAQYKAQGIASPQDYAKRVLTGKIDATIAADAWSHAGEATLRTLGVDPLRMNKANLQRLPTSGLLSFVNQPLRMARLLNEYIREGRTDRLAYLAAMTLLLGGQASIPVSVRLLGEHLAPEATYAFEKAANDLSIPGAIGNAAPELKPFIPNISQKIDYDPLNPYGFASVGLGYDTAKQVYGAADNLAKDVVKGDASAGLDDGWKLGKSASNLTGARIGPVPASMMFKGAEAIQQSNDGYMPVNFYSGDKNLGPGVSVDLDQFPGGRMAPIADRLLPGQSQLAAEMKLNKQELADRKGVNDGNDAYFADPVKGLTSMLTKKRKQKQHDDINEYMRSILADKN